MICDAVDFDDHAVLQADICIVGAGAAGITLALQFLSGAHSVILLESGGERPQAATQGFYAGDVAQGSLHAPPDTYRERRLGGTTAIWGGRCMPFDAIDFEPRDWIAGPRWPFGFETLGGFYAEANRLCEAGENAYTAEAAFPRGMRPMLQNFRGTHFTDNTLERFSCPTHFGRRYRRRLHQAANLRVILHASLTAIRTTDDGRVVDRLEVRTLGSRRLHVQARYVVLAAGGLEIPRLLLASRDRHANGIGNAHDQVGRHYMCHMAGTVGEIRFEAGAGAVFHGYEVAEDGVYCRRRFALTPASQRALGVGNFIARLHHPAIPDPAHRTGALSALFLAKPFIRAEYRKRLHGQGRTPWPVTLAHLGNVLGDPAGTAGFLGDWAWRRTLAERKLPSVVIRSRTRTYSIDFHAEQVPNPQSRVCLSRATDAFGMNRILVDWRHSDQDILTVREGVASLAHDLLASGCGRLVYDPAEIETEALRHGAYGGHHIGTARMASDQRRGVVDAECRVHGMANLYLAGSAVFPTSSQANPTLTIVALALRLAKHLRHQTGGNLPAGTTSEGKTNPACIRSRPACVV